MGVRRGIDRKWVGCRSLIDANLEGQVGVNKFKIYDLVNTKDCILPVCEKRKVQKGRRLKFCGTVHCTYIFN